MQTIDQTFFVKIIIVKKVLQLRGLFVYLFLHTFAIDIAYFSHPTKIRENQR
jgi:hypothetical protein